MYLAKSILAIRNVGEVQLLLVLSQGLQASFSLGSIFPSLLFFFGFVSFCFLARTHDSLEGKSNFPWRLDQSALENQPTLPKHIKPDLINNQVAFYPLSFTFSQHLVPLNNRVMASVLHPLFW